MRVVVVGGGVAGLAAAHRLRQRGAEVLVLERADRLGGKIHTGSLAGAPVETGAETFLMRENGADSAVLDLARELGLGPKLVHPAPVPAAIAVDGALRPVPGGTLLGVPADPSTIDGYAGQDVDSGQPLLSAGQDIGVGQLVRGRYGDSIVDRLVDPLLGGVYAGRADLLSLATTMPGLYEAAQRESTLAGAVSAALAAAPRPTGQPVFASVQGGLSTLVDAMADGLTVKLNSTVRELAPVDNGWSLTVGSTRDAQRVTADAVILAVPAAPASRLLERAAGNGVDVATLDYASIALVTLALPAGTRLPELSGFLVPATEGYSVKAATFFSTKWSRPDGPVMVRTSIGRYGETEVLQRDDGALTDLARAELARIIDAPLPDPLASAVYRWGGGLPQYGVGHLDRVARVRNSLPATLAVAGAAYDGVGIAACVRSGQAAADSIWRSLGE